MRTGPDLHSPGRPVPSWPRVSVIMAVRNESRHLREAVEAAVAQRYPGELEVVVAVGPSDDDTEQQADDLARRHDCVTVVDNPRGSTPAGLNAAITVTAGSIIARVDGHAVLPDDYLRRAVELLEQTGADNVGGIMDAQGVTPFQRAVAAVMTSRFGAGDARFHTGGPPGPVDTVYLGVFRREALERIGWFDEHFTRAQDAELNHRLRASGGVVYFHSDLRVRYRPRETPAALARQFFHYGRWRRVIVRRHAGSVRWRQLVPAVTLLANVAGVLVGTFVHRSGWVLPGGYLTAVGAASVVAGRGLGRRAGMLVPVAFMIVHGAWALGFLTSPRRLATVTLSSHAAAAEYAEGASGYPVA